MSKKPAFVVRSPAQGLKVINHPDIAANFDRALKRTPKHSVAVLVPCAATKPFPDAPSHKSGYLDALAGKKVDKHVVSEPLGVVPYEWSRKYPNDSYDFPPEYLKDAAFDALAKRIGKWFDVVGKKYDRIYCALPAHHSRLVKAALRGKKTSHITWVGQRQCLDKNVCAEGEYRATTHSYRGFLKKNVRGAANRGHANRGRAARAQVAPETGLWRLDATGRTTGGNTYALRWYEPGSSLVGALAGRHFQPVYKTSSLRVWWLRVLADVGNELMLRPDQVDVDGLRALARRGWRRTPVSAPDAVRIQGLREHYRAHYGGGSGRGNGRPLADTELDIIVLAKTFKGNPRSAFGPGFHTPTPAEVDHALQRLRLGGLITRRGDKYTVTPPGMELLERLVPAVLRGQPDPPPVPEQPSVNRPRFKLLKGGRKNRRGRRKLPCQILRVDDGSENEHHGWADELFLDAGVNVSSTEEPLFACVNSDDETVGLLVAGLRPGGWGDGSLEMTFSVAVRRDYSRRGIARGLVKALQEHFMAEQPDLLEAHGASDVELVAWVINPHLAVLLEELGFDSDGSEWSLDEPHMRWRG